MITQSNISAAELMKQAGYTAEAYLIDAIHSIDKFLGDGYAAEHPELIAAYMNTAARDFDTCLHCNTNAEIAQEFIDIITTLKDQEETK
ncbi:MAG TPA: hypothetical protein VNF46_05465 [Gammaproteobacteria bacterium]|nr:hypothetical protein [Gammaproteobacteria bacterium]